MFPEQFQSRVRRAVEAAVSPLAAVGMSPNAATVLGFLLNVVTAGVIASGHLSIGGVFLFVSAVFDMLDGALARVMRRQSSFGAFLDSLLDRYSEAAILAALIYVFTVRGQTAEVVLAYVVAVGSIMISYARARAEAIGFKASVGLVARPERVILLAVCLIIGQPLWALWALAILTQITAFTRIAHVWRLATAESAATKS